jgi:uncharacterized protein YaeQ
MALDSTIYRFKISLSDIDRDLYTSLEFRLPRHPSESLPFFITRISAYALNFEEKLEFSLGLSDPDAPSLFMNDLTGKMLLWIDIGNPSAKRLHKAAKAADRVKVITYRDPSILIRELESEVIHRKSEIEIASLPSTFVQSVGETLERDNHWELLNNQDELSLKTASGTFTTEVGKHRLHD